MRNLTSADRYGCSGSVSVNYLPVGGGAVHSRRHAFADKSGAGGRGAGVPGGLPVQQGRGATARP